MSKELEIEFKNMLSKEHYEQLLSFFNFGRSDAKTQENHYLDTENFHLKEKFCALRIRRKKDYFECTLKIPAAEGNYEITDELTAQKAQNILSGKSFDAPEVLSALQEMAIDPLQLKLIGTLTTHRIELDYQDGLLVLDHSEYIGVDDYEIEYEVTDAEIGKRIFYDFLKQQGIPVRFADKKIARFMKAAKRH